MFHTKLTGTTNDMTMGIESTCGPHYNIYINDSALHDLMHGTGSD